MAEHPGSDEDPGGGPAPPESRGRTVISERALRHLAERAAAGCAGTVRHTSGAAPGHGLGTSLPRARATASGERVRLQVEIACLWGEPLAEVAAATREHVRDRVATLTGKRVDAVDVRVAAVLPEPPGRAARSRRRVS